MVVVAVTFCYVPQSEPNAQETMTYGKSEELPTNNRTRQENPSEQVGTIQQVVDAASRAKEASTEKTKASQNSSPPNDAPWLFQLLLTIFTGGLVVVGAVQCYIIFKTLKETQKSADAAKASADALPIMERAYIFVEVRRKEELKEFVIGQNFCEIVVMNEGKTPAIRKYINKFAKVFVLPYTIPKIPCVPYPNMPRIEEIVSE